MPKFQKETDDMKNTGELKPKEEKCGYPQPNVGQQIADLKKAVVMLMEAVDILRQSNDEIRKALKDNMMAGRYGSYPNALADE